jgi:hypothetical protein
VRAGGRTVAVASSRRAAAVGASASSVSAAALHFDVLGEVKSVGCVVEKVVSLCCFDRLLAKEKGSRRRGRSGAGLLCP